MTKAIPHSLQLKSELERIESEMVRILEASRFERYIKPTNPFTSLGSNPPTRPQILHRWTELRPNDAEAQIRLFKQYETWHASFMSLFWDKPTNQQAELLHTHATVQGWIRSRQHSKIPESNIAAVESFKRDIRPFFDRLDALADAAKGETILIPDTNAVIDYPDLSSYEKIINRPQYEIVITSTVIGELDKLKRLHANKEMRARVVDIIRRLKQWRATGDVVRGVQLSDAVTLRMIPNEPDFKQAPSWLDPENNDDRIVASALEIQRGNPGATVILITSDLNMQNKASMAHMPSVDPSESLNGTAP
jgi:hypothetical protein